MFSYTDNPFMEMLKTQLDKLEKDEISKEFYVALTKNLLRNFERWLDEITKLALMNKILDINPIKVEPKNSNFDTKQD